MLVEQNGYYISTNKELLNRDVIYNFLDKESYWANEIPYEYIDRFIKGSFCFGVYTGKPGESDSTQVGFARVVSDGVTFAYLADVFILPEYRKQGLSKWLMEEIMGYEKLSTVRTFMLKTRDAHNLYRKYGFEVIDNSKNRFMAILKDNLYRNMKNNRE
ncbi:MULTISPECIES: GNAT family N-acetyltransferase [Bacillaceae]|uniref:GNAT family N-acetyltransferase n=1 Tax=Bacillaceae TaxID=186817 RepID=UPI000BECDFF8|nr:MULTISPECIES: GNAT family N-acetyltransferase [unclassified Bacillus (in: firmicutes)]PEC50724.1 GNAT family N-acetyltransferase [Bacillus sp. AFS096315]PFM80089.1 GNAT family N-acetyltransferase [Bacillus sp. AFS077874]